MCSAEWNTAANQQTLTLPKNQALSSDPREPRTESRGPSPTQVHLNLGNTLKKLFWGAVGISAGALIYGALVESNNLVIRHRKLQLPRWPKSHSGFRIGLLADFHIRDQWSFELALRAVNAVLDESPDMVVIPGDFVGYWKDEAVDWLGRALEPLLVMQGAVVAVPGNHDHCLGSPEIMMPILNDLNIKLLRNEAWVRSGIQWIGIDSANADHADPFEAMAAGKEKLPTIAVWHEPDMVDWLPEGADLMLSGHSHGGQFLTPWGQPFMGSKNGKRYRRGWFPDAPTPLYVTSGVGTTGPPSRLFCPPEVVILELESQ